MNVSATSPTNPPLTVGGTVTNARPVDTKGGSLTARPIVRVTDDTAAAPKSVPPREPRTADSPSRPEAPPELFNVDGLLAEWGSTDSAYDLDGNGQVDGWDLALFLGGERPKGGEAEYNVQGLLENWGQTDSPYDLDNNGNVDGWDLALFLGGQRPGDAPAPDSTSNALSPDDAVADQPSVITNEPGVVADETSQPQKLRHSDPEAFLDRFARAVFRGAGIRPGDQIPLDQLKIDNIDETRLDPDGDGLVKPRELRDFIQRDIASRLENEAGFRPRPAANEWVARIGQPVPNDALVSHPGRDVIDDKGEKHEAALKRLSAFVGGKLDKAGFSERPPRNLHAVLARLDLSGNDRAFLLKSLANKYPNGLGVNRVG